MYLLLYEFALSVFVGACRRLLKRACPSCRPLVSSKTKTSCLEIAYLGVGGLAPADQPKLGSYPLPPNVVTKKLDESGAVVLLLRGPQPKYPLGVAVACDDVNSVSQAPKRKLDIQALLKQDPPLGILTARSTLGRAVHEKRFVGSDDENATYLFEGE